MKPSSASRSIPVTFFIAGTSNFRPLWKATSSASLSCSIPSLGRPFVLATPWGAYRKTSPESRIDIYNTVDLSEDLEEAVRLNI